MSDTTQSPQDTERITGIAYRPFDPDDGREFGKCETRHEAVGRAAVFGRILDKDLTVRAGETMWEEHDKAVVCGYCGHATKLSPIVGWTFVAGCEASPFCTKQCHARYEYEQEGSK